MHLYAFSSFLSFNFPSTQRFFVWAIVDRPEGRKLAVRWEIKSIAVSTDWMTFYSSGEALTDA